MAYSLYSFQIITFYFYSALLVWNSLYEKNRLVIDRKRKKKYSLIHRRGAQLRTHSLKDVLLCEEDWKKSGVRWGSAPDK